MTDGIIKIAGGDYISFIGIDLQENSANDTPTKQMEWGYAIVKGNPTNGSQNITITNCAVTLNKTNTATKGIYGGNHTAVSISSLTIADAAGTNANIKINGCTISNCYNPIYIAGYYNASTYYDTGLEIGTTAGNTLTNYGGATLITTGILVEGQTAPKVEKNSITLTGEGQTGIAYGIFIYAHCLGNVKVDANIISVSSSATTGDVYGIYNGAPIATTLDITNNTIQHCIFTTATTAKFAGIYEAAATTGATVNINGNTVDGITYSDASLVGFGNVYGIWQTSSFATTVNANNNSIKNISRTGSNDGSTYGISISGVNETVNYNNIFGFSRRGTGTGGHIYCIVTTAGTVAVTGNTIHDIKITQASAVSAAMYGIYMSNPTSTADGTFTNNVVDDVATASTGMVCGIYLTTNLSSKTVSGNTLYGLSSSGNVAEGLLLYGGAEIFSNKIYSISSSSTTPSAKAFGINIGAATTVNIYNNMISDLNAPEGSSSTTSVVAGINISNGTTVRAYFNTIYLNASTGDTDFSTSGIVAGTSVGTELINNIVVNTSIANGMGFATAYRRSDATLTSYTAASNNNCFYAGTPSSHNLIFYDGTNADQTLAAYKSRMSTRDQASVTENVPFVNGAATPYDLHINTSTPTQVEGGGIAISSPIVIAADYAGNARSATPDIGAYEFTGTAAMPVELTSFTAFPTANTVSLRWSTATETNNFGFDIERKTGLAWQKIGFIEGHGSTNAPQLYIYADNSASGKVSYRLKQIDRDGKFEYSKEVEATIVATPVAFTLSQNYPNPFNPSTVINYSIASASHASLKVFDILGREVAVLVNGQMTPGNYTTTFDASRISSGVYFYRLDAGSFTDVKRLSVMK